MFLKLIHMVGVRKSEFFSHISQASHVPSGEIKSMAQLQPQLRFSSSQLESGEYSNSAL